MGHRSGIITKDDDFVGQFRRLPVGPVIVWLRIGNACNRVLLVWFMTALPSLVQRIEAGISVEQARLMLARL